ncbi:MAG: hypothetical protein IKU82_06140 [Clostridia bacterium]|nr:hypothetical protein [Clostridia bacterium]
MKNLGFKILYVATLLVTVIELGFILKDSLFTDIAKLPTGVLEQVYDSPNDDRKMNVYVVKTTLGEGVRIEIEQGEEKYNIFWQTGIDTVEAKWTNNDTIMINDVPLDANDRFGYDCRRGISLFDEGSLEQNFTNFRGKK